MSDLIAPQVLKGFRDSLPQSEIPKRQLIARLEAAFARFGFVPIDTPALEYAEILLGKGGGETEKQIYRFQDHGGRDVALRFDLTVPFARFMAAHKAEVPLPFKRSHIAKVWRGENTQRGRYREFMQCDIDIVGADSAAADAEILAVLARALESLEIGGFRLRVNHRGLFQRFLARRGWAEQSVEILRTVDKRAKIGDEETLRQLGELVGGPAAGAEKSADAGKAAGSDPAAAILDFITPRESWQATLDHLSALAGGPGPDSERLAQVFALLDAQGLGGRLVLDPSITRGLDYYTGLVFETLLDDLPGIGSVCSGGRYNDLASLYTKDLLPGVGGSVGLDRLLAALEELGRIQPRAGLSDLMVFWFDESQMLEAHRCADRLRQEGLNVELNLEARKAGALYKYAEAKGIELVAAAQASGGWQLKHLPSGRAENAPDAEGLTALLKRRFWSAS